MMNKKFEEKFLNVIKKNLLVKKRITMEDDVKSFQKWDSLNNIRILVDLNKTFKKNININKIGNIKTLKDLGKYFLQKLFDYKQKKKPHNNYFYYSIILLIKKASALFKPTNPPLIIDKAWMFSNDLG